MRTTPYCKLTLLKMPHNLFLLNQPLKDLLALIAEEVTKFLQLDEIRLAHEGCEMLENDEKLALLSLRDSRKRSAPKQ